MLLRFFPILTTTICWWGSYIVPHWNPLPPRVGKRWFVMSLSVMWCQYQEWWNKPSQPLSSSSRDDPIQHGSLKHTFIAFSAERKKRSGGGRGEIRALQRWRCRGGGHFNHRSISPAWHSSHSTAENVSVSSWVKGECKHTREHLWQNVRSLFGGSGWRGGGEGCSDKESEAAHGLGGPMWEQGAPEG